VRTFARGGKTAPAWKIALSGPIYYSRRQLTPDFALLAEAL
jgi:hypothetical protein